MPTPVPDKVYRPKINNERVSEVNLERSKLKEKVSTTEERKLEKLINNHILKAQEPKYEPQLFKKVKEESELIKALTKVKPETEYEPKIKYENVSEVNFQPKSVPPLYIQEPEK